MVCTGPVEGCRMSRRKAATRRRKRLSVEPLEPRRLLDVTGIWQEMGFRSASGGGMTSGPFFLDDYEKMCRDASPFMAFLCGAVGVEF